MIYEIGTRVKTPDGSGVVEFITKRGMPKMGYTVCLDIPIECDGDTVERIHVSKDEVEAVK